MGKSFAGATALLTFFVFKFFVIILKSLEKVSFPSALALIRERCETAQKCFSYYEDFRGVS